jgi:hypothetical protein
LGDALVLRFEHIDQAKSDATNKEDTTQMRCVTVVSRGAQWESRFRKLTDELASNFTVLARG